MGELAELYRYPLSGARGEVLESVAVTAAGLEGDHEYIAFDAAEYAFASSHIYRRIDQKSEAGARLAQVTAAWQQGPPQLTLTYQGETSPTLEIFEKPCSVDEFGDVPAILKQMTPAAGMRDFGVYAYPIDVTQDSRPTIHLGDCVELAV